MYSSCTGNNEKQIHKTKLQLTQVIAAKKKEKKEEKSLYGKYLSLVVVEQNSMF